jgi:hypothetical protein
MKRPGIITVLCAIALSSCVRPGDLPAEDVLMRSSVANRGLVSARFSVHTQISNDKGLDGSLLTDGVMQQGGRQLRMNISTSGKTAEGMNWNGIGEMIVLSENEVYMNIREASTEPPQPMLMFSTFTQTTGRWLQLPTQNEGVATDTITPDPRLLRMQSDVIRVVRDRGLVNLDGRDAYRYDVEVDPVRLAAFLQETNQGESIADTIIDQLNGIDADGEIWIDAENFLLTRANWTVVIPQNGSMTTLHIQMQLTDIGIQAPIIAPSPVEPLPDFPLLPPPEASIMLEL